MIETKLFFLKKCSSALSICKNAPVSGPENFATAAKVFNFSMELVRLFEEKRGVRENALRKKFLLMTDAG